MIIFTENVVLAIMINLSQNNNPAPTDIQKTGYFDFLFNWIPQINFSSLFSIWDMPQQTNDHSPVQRNSASLSDSSSDSDWDYIKDAQQIKLMNEKIQIMSTHPIPKSEKIVQLWQETLPTGNFSPILSETCLTAASSKSSIDED